VEASGVEVLHRVDGTHHDTVGLADSGQLLGEIEIECELRHGSDDYRDLTQDVSIAHRKHSSTKFKYNCLYAKRLFLAPRECKGEKR
jgi:hypothetical protein